jgi:hypothetical protein
VPGEPLRLRSNNHLSAVSSMLLKGAMRRRQVSKTWCLAERCHGESPEACIALRVRREAL